MVPGSVSATPESLVRLSGTNPAYVIQDELYSDAGQRVLTIDGAGNRTRFSYDTVGRVTEKVEADGTPAAARTGYVYDAVGNTVQEIRPRTYSEGGMFVTASTYTGRNLLASETKAYGTNEASTTTYTYTPTRQRRTVTDGRGNTRETVYGACCDRAIREIDERGGVTLMTYDAVGHRTSVMDPNGNVTRREYDALGRVIADTDGEGARTTHVYDDNLSDGVGIDAVLALGQLGFGPGADGEAEATTNGMNETTYTVKDPQDRVVYSVDSSGRATLYRYDTLSSGYVEASTTNPAGETSVQLSDAAGQVVRQIDPAGKQSSFEYDAAGHLVAEHDANGVGGSCVVDAWGRELECTDSAGVRTSAAYDTEGNKTMAVDGMGAATVCTYTARNQVVRCNDRLGNARQYQYDPNGNAISSTDAEGYTTTLVFDAANLPTEQSYPDGGIVRREYDLGGRLTAVTMQDGLRRVFVYDRANRLLTRLYPDALNDEFTYDAASRVVSARSLRYATLVQRTYDGSGRLSTETLTVDGAARTSSFGYDAAGRRSWTLYPSGDRVDRTYDERGLPATTLFNGAAVASFTHDDGGRVLSTALPFGKSEARTYRADGLIQSIVLGDLLTFNYSYNANGRRIAQARDGATESYSYDAEERLVGWTTAAETQTWALSAEGDWQTWTASGVSQSRTHDSMHAVRSVGAAAISYDPVGNVSQDEQGRVLSWDPAGRLAGVRMPSGETVAYRYDATGRRVARAATAGTDVFVYDDQEIIAEYRNGQVSREYVLGNAIDEPIAVVAGQQTYFLGRDQNRSISLLVTSAGQVAERYQYSPYGARIVRGPDGAVRQSSAFGISAGYTGRWHDETTGLVDFRAREYSPTLGRFLSRDQRYDDGFGLYRNAFAPDQLDPTGQWSLGGAWKAVKKYGAKAAGVVLAPLTKLFGIKIGLQGRAGVTYDLCSGALSFAITSLQASAGLSIAGVADVSVNVRILDWIKQQAGDDLTWTIATLPHISCTRSCDSCCSSWLPSLTEVSGSADIVAVKKYLEYLKTGTKGSSPVSVNFGIAYAPCMLKLAAEVGYNFFPDSPPWAQKIGLEWNVGVFGGVELDFVPVNGSWWPLNTASAQVKMEGNASASIDTTKSDLSKLLGG